MENHLLENAIRLAVNAHLGQFDKGGNPYILHPLHVMSQMDTIDEMIVAVLHDVLEDTQVTAEILQSQGFPDHIIEALKLLTKSPDQDYKEYILKIKANKLATKVKLADMRHNSDLTRIHIVEEKHIKMIKKYHWATLTLRG